MFKRTEKSRLLTVPEVKAAFDEVKRELSFSNNAMKVLSVGAIAGVGLGFSAMPLLGAGIFWGSLLSALFFSNSKDSSVLRVKQACGDAVGKELARMDQAARTSLRALEDFKAEMKYLTGDVRANMNYTRTNGFVYFIAGAALLATTPFGWGAGFLTAGTWLVASVTGQALESYKKEPVVEAIAAAAEKLSAGQRAGVYGAVQPPAAPGATLDM